MSYYFSINDNNIKCGAIKMYKLFSIPTLNMYGVFRIADNAFIPFDPANADYQAYLKWLEEGNEPLPADEPAA